MKLDMGVSSYQYKLRDSISYLYPELGIFIWSERSGVPISIRM